MNVSLLAVHLPHPPPTALSPAPVGSDPAPLARLACPPSTPRGHHARHIAAPPHPIELD